MHSIFPLTTGDPARPLSSNKRGFAEQSKKFEAILWDMDGTLADSEQLHFASLLSVLKTFGVDAGPELYESTAGKTGRETHRLCVERFKKQFDYAEWSSLRASFFNQNIDQLQERRGVLAICDAAMASGLKQAVVSNSGRKILNAGINALRLDRYIAVSISAGDVAEGKPAPEGYLKAAALLGLTAEKVVVVEDSEVGAQSAVAARMSVIVWPNSGSDLSGFPSTANFVENARELGAALGLKLGDMA